MKRRSAASLVLAALLPACDPNGASSPFPGVVLDGVSPASPNSSQLPTFSGRAAAGALVEIFSDPAGTGTPLSTGTALSSGAFAITVSVPRPSQRTYYAFATPPRGPRVGPSNGLLYASRTGGFSPEILIATGDLPWEPVAGDFNEDGIPDLALAHGAADEVGVYLGQGDGNFSALTGPFAVGSGPRGLTATDLNNDGHLDLAVSNISGHSVSVLLGAGDGTFATSAGSPVAVGTNPFFIAAADVDGDGDADLGVGNFSSANVSLLLGAGDGTFAPAASSPLAVAGQPTGLQFLDLDGQGGLDLAVVSSDALYVFLGQGDATFVPATGSPFAVQGSGALAARDLDGDGRLDLVFADFDDDLLSAQLGLGDGGFASGPGTPLAAGGSNPQYVALEDLDSDGRPDAAVSLWGSAAIAFRSGDGAGGFGAALIIPAGAGPRGVVAGDWNGDGLPDLAIASGGGDALRVLLSK